MGFIWLKLWLLVGSCEYGNELSDSIIYGKLLGKWETDRYRKKTVEHNKNYLLLHVVTQYHYLLYNATSFDPTMGSSSGQEQKFGDMKCK
jgi:hypothetical protein